LTQKITISFLGVNPNNTTLLLTGLCALRLIIIAGILAVIFGAPLQRVWTCQMINV